MRKKDYIETIDEIKIEKQLKKKTFEKIKEQKTYTKRIYAISCSIIVFVIAISIAIPVNNNRNKATPIEVIEENSGLPKIENFENLYNMIKDKDTAYYENGPIFIDESSSFNEIASDSIKEENSESTKSEIDYSKTNVQVDGVDEADIVKTDGEYIYYATTNKLIIANASEPNNLKIVSEIKYDKEDMYSIEIFVNNNKLIVIGQKNIYKENNDNNRIYYDLLYAPNSYTIAKIYNIQNREKPVFEREIQIEGSYLSSRMIGENVYIVSNKYMYWNLLETTSLEELNEEEFKPKYVDTAIDANEQCIDYSDIYYFPESEDTSYLNIAGFNISNNEPANIESYLGAGEELYSSQNNLYITRVKYDYKDSKLYGYYNNYDVNTYIYKFKLEDSKITYTNVGSVPGEVLNQFSMDEDRGYFRIATTDSDSWNSETNTNNLYVLNENLEIIGKVENLAKGERIYSVRFMEDRAYMVTFVETDPLFVIDLKDPKNPIVLGELKIPGYSKYLHPYDANHIIGFGENTKVNAYGGVVTNGMKMALFDVSNPNNPKELYSIDIGEKGTYSELLYNHKALLFSKEKNIIAFPVSITKEEGEYRTNLKFQGALVYKVDLDTGFSLKGKIAHMEVEDGYRNYDYTKQVERIIYVRDNLYTLSKGLIKVTNIDTMEEQGKLEIK